MRISRLIGIALGGVVAIYPAFSTTYAPSTASVAALSATNDSAGENVGPYPGTFGGVSSKVYCDDLVHNIQVGSTINVNVSDLSDLHLTRFGGSGAATVLTNVVAVMDYKEIFYLSTFLSGTYSTPSSYYSTRFAQPDGSANTTVTADIQDAMWSIFAPATANATSNAVQYWLNQAATNYAKYDYSTYRILTDSAANTATTGQYNGNQELFLNLTPGNPLRPTPEPASLAMLGSGLAALGLGFRRRKAKT